LADEIRQFPLDEKGVPMGTAMAFEMSAVGVSLPELILRKRVMTVPLLTLLSAIVLVGTAIIGDLFNACWKDRTVS